MVSPLGDVYTAPAHLGGLTPFGAQVIKECNRLGIVVDLAHGTYETVTGALKAATQPLIISHTGLSRDAGRSTPSADMQRRLITREHAREVADAGGVIGVWWRLVGTLKEYVAAIRDMVDAVGVDHVGIGTDQRFPWGLRTSHAQRMSDVVPSYSSGSPRRSHLDQSRICEDDSMMRKGQLLMLFRHQATDRCLNRWRVNPRTRREDASADPTDQVNIPSTPFSKVSIPTKPGVGRGFRPNFMVHFLTSTVTASKGWLLRFCSDMLDGRPPGDVTGFVFYRRDLACRVFGPKVLIGEKDGYTIRRMRVHGSHSVWRDPDPQNPHLGVLKFQLVVAGIYLERIEIAGDRSCLSLVSSIRSR